MPLKVTSTKKSALPTALLKISIPVFSMGPHRHQRFCGTKAVDALQLQLAKTWIFFSEGRASVRKYSHSIKMSRAKTKPLTAFEGKGMSCGFFWGRGGAVEDINAFFPG